MKNKLFILIFLLSFPSVLYVVLTTGKHNFIHLPFYGEKELAPNKKDTIYHVVPAFKFVNQNADTITNKSFDEKIYIVNYFFTTCKTTCPKMTTELIHVQEKFAYTNGLVQILSHTVNPENDSVQVLNRYAIMVHADTKTWNFVTGDKKQLYNLAQKGYLLNMDTGNNTRDEFIHSEFFILVDKEKHIRGIYKGTNNKAVSNLIDDVKVLLAEYFIKDNAKKKFNNM